MRAILQRVSSASVTVDEAVVGSIEHGLLVLVGYHSQDGEQELVYMRDKILKLRIFPSLDTSSGFDRSVVEVGGGVLLVSQFTLYASTVKGRRPSFIDAAPGEVSQALYERTVELFKQSGVTVATGVFGAQMQVSLVNDGPATFTLETPA